MVLDIVHSTDILLVSFDPLRCCSGVTLCFTLMVYSLGLLSVLSLFYTSGAKIEVPSVLPGFISGLLPWLNHVQYKELLLDMRQAFAFIVLGRDKGR